MNILLLIIYAILILGPIYLIRLIFLMNRKMKKIDWLSNQEYTVLRIDVPRNNERSPLAAEQMFASIHGIYSESARYQNHLSFEIVARDKYIQFYIYLPTHLKDFVEGQIYAQYPTVEIKEVEDYVNETNISEKSFAVCELALNKPDVYPIKQFTDFEVDPISGITSVMSKLNEGEEVWFQAVIRPVGDEWQYKGHNMVNNVRLGKKDGRNKGIFFILATLLGKFLGALFSQAMNPNSEYTDAKTEVKLPAAVEEALKLIEQKITKLGFETKLRVMTISDTPELAKMKCQNIVAAFKQFNTINLNGFKIGGIVQDDPTAWKDFALRSFEKNGNILNISELASVYHLPHMSVTTPNIVWSGSKKGEPPSNLPLRSNTSPEDFTVLGLTNFRNTTQEFGIKLDDRRRHTYIIGKSGVGKSTLMENMAQNDILANRGIIIVDPHGETADKILACIPDERINDVIVFDPSDREYPIAFNLLESVDDDFKGLVASGFVGIFKKIFGESWGPRLEHILRNTVLALLDYGDSTMLDIPKMLTNAAFRQKVVDKVKDMVIKEFWINEFAQYDAKFRTEAVSPILNKVGQFLSSSTIRNIVGQPKSRINIREIMDQEKILIVNLSRGKIGEDNSSLLGAMMITKIQLAAMSRADVTIDQRADCFLYVDEFQNFATESFATILSEARKYNLSLIMAHQYIAQMQDPVRDAVFGNAGTLISYRVGAADADFLVKEFEPVFTANDLVNLDKYNIYIKLLVDGVAAPAFSARTLPPVGKLSGNLEKVLANSRATNANSRSVIEEQISLRAIEEEERLRKEADIYKSGGLEALLMSKSGGSQQFNQEKPKAYSVEPEKSVQQVENLSPVQAQAPVQFQAQNTVAASEDTDQKKATVGESEKIAEKVYKPKIIKYNNIIDGKLYKEKTARAGVKWYVGEKVDEEKLEKSGTQVDEIARNIIEATSKTKSNEKSTSLPTLAEVKIAPVVSPTAAQTTSETIGDEKAITLAAKTEIEIAPVVLPVVAEVEELISTPIIIPEQPIVVSMSQKGVDMKEGQSHKIGDDQS